MNENEQVQSKEAKVDDKVAKVIKVDDKEVKANDRAAKSITQEELSKMMAKEKHQGRAAALRDLGIDPKDKEAVAKFKALVEGQKTPQQKETEKVIEENEALRDAEARALQAEAKVEVMKLGVRADFVDDAITLISNKADDKSDIKELVEDLKKRHPSWFAKEGDEKGNTNKSGTGKSVSTLGNNNSEEKSLGARLAAQRKSQMPKQSFWKK